MSVARPAPGGDANLVTWHDVECGGYTADLALWHELARAAAGPILDVGAGTGRVSLSLARAGHRVVALDAEPAVLAALRERAAGLPVDAVTADARSFALPERFALALAPMQTVQLLGGRPGRRAFLARAAEHLALGGRVAIALVTRLEPFSAGDPLPCPDVAGALVSQPVALREEDDGWTIERVRRRGGQETRDEVRLDRVSADELEREGAAAGLVPLPRRRVAATAEHVGAEVVVLAGG